MEIEVEYIAGDTKTTAQGYVLQRVGTTWVPQHRLAMEAKLGRALVTGESVHHINGVRDDNRPENLELWAAPIRFGQRVDDLIAYVVEFHREKVLAALG